MIFRSLKTQILWVSTQFQYKIDLNVYKNVMQLGKPENFRLYCLICLRLIASKENSKKLFLSKFSFSFEQKENLEKTGTYFSEVKYFDQIVTWMCKQLVAFFSCQSYSFLVFNCVWHLKCVDNILIKICVINWIHHDLFLKGFLPAWYFGLCTCLLRGVLCRYLSELWALLRSIQEPLW